MVTYELIRCEESKLEYAYWPEGDRASKQSAIVVDLGAETVLLAVPAERDFQSHTTGSAMNMLRDSINQTRAENGEPPLLVEEFPIDPEESVHRWCWYYDHVLRDLSRRHNEGEIAERGTVYWY